jgi:PAS domain S-box-containing protein
LVVALAPDGEVEFVNRQGLEFFGQPLEELKHWGTNGAIHPEDLPRLIEDFTRAIASGCPFEWEVRGRRFDGVYRWFQSRGFPLRDASGRIIRWYNLLVDVDERKRAEEELRQAYARLAEAQRLTKTGSFVTDLLADRNWSEEIFRIFEFDPATKVTVQTLREVVHAEDQPLFDAAIARAMAGTDVDYVFRIVTSRGAVKHLRTTAHMIEPIAGRRLFVGALQDVTESKVAEDALNRARTELAHVARVATVSALTASIAHEVNQPLSGIITNASTCLRMLDANPPDVDGARETARRTIRDGNRASDVITRLRALFSKKEFALESLDLNDATREVIALSLSDLQRQRVVLQSEFADDLPKVTGDRVQLQQVILNLVRNASDAMMDVDDRPRQLLVRTERENGDRVRVMVRDSGIGVDRQSMDKLFDAFYTTKSGGMGIGLSVSRSIVERHQGRLWAEPNDGPGATFSFSIPLEPIPRSHGQWPTD